MAIDPAMTSTIHGNGTSGYGAVPIPKAKARYAMRPAATPAGMPTTRPATTTVSACHRRVARSCRPTPPRARNTASSRRRARAATAIASPSPSAMATARRAARAAGTVRMAATLTIVAGRTGVL
jgi:hypothetical protein